MKPGTAACTEGPGGRRRDAGLCRKLLLIALAILAGVAGCVPPDSLRPFYLDEQVYFDEALLGAWVDSSTSSPKEPWVFGRLGEDAYAMVVPLGDNLPLQSIGHLFRRDDVTLLNVEPAFAYIDSLAPYPLVRGHTLLLLEWEAASLKIAVLDASWWERRLEEKQRALGHEWIEPHGGDTERSLVLTATTRELQTFLRSGLRNGHPFATFVELHRVGQPTE